MDHSINRALFFQNSLRIQQVLQVGIHGEVRKLPLDDASEPHQRAHIKKPDGAECFLTPQDGKACNLKLSGCQP